MEIEQSFSVAYPLDDVWASFHDTPGIVACLPGASLAAPPDNGQLKLAMTVKLGPIVANFAGDGEMTLDEAAKRGSVSGGGVDRKSASRVKGVAAFALHAVAPRETRVDVTVDYSIAGTLAQFSRGGIVKELATRMTDAFAQNLKVKLDAAQVAPATGGNDDVAVDAVDTAAATAAAAAAAAAPDHAHAQPVSTAAAQSAPTAVDDVPTDRVLAQPAAVEPTRQQIMQSIAEAQTTPASAAGTAPKSAPVASTVHSATRAPQTSSPAPMPQNAPLDLGNLFWKMLWARVRGWLGFGASSR